MLRCRMYTMLNVCVVSEGELDHPVQSFLDLRVWHDQDHSEAPRGTEGLVCVREKILIVCV